MISKLWGFGAALIITCLPLSESAHDAQHIIEGIASSIVSYVMNVSSIDGEDHDRSENVSGQQKKSICIQRERKRKRPVSNILVSGKDQTTACINPVPHKNSAYFFP